MDLDTILSGFFSKDFDRLVAAVRAIGGPDVSCGPVTRGVTFRRRGGRLLYDRGGLFCERLFGPAEPLCCACGAKRGEAHEGESCDRCGVMCSRDVRPPGRWAHLDVVGIVHPLLFAHAGTALAHVEDIVDEVLRGELWLRGDDDLPIPRARARIGDRTGPAAIRTIVERHTDPDDPRRLLCAITRIPVPPPVRRPCVHSSEETRIDPWLGPVNLAWLALVSQARREQQLIELSAPEIIVRSEAAATQARLLEVLEASEPPLPLVPPLVSVPDDLEDIDALALAYVRPGVWIVQRTRGVFLVSEEDGHTLLSAPPCGFKLVGMLDERTALFDDFLPGLDPAFHPEAWGHREQDAILGSMSALDCESGSYLATLPTPLPGGHVAKGEPEELFYVDPAGRSRPLHVGSDRPERLACTRDLRFAWIGEPGAGSEVIELATGITHVLVEEPVDDESTEVLSLDDSVEEDEFADDGPAAAVTFRDGRWHFLWPNGVYADHACARVLRLGGAVVAGAFDPWEPRLAVISGDEIVIVDLERAAIVRRFPLPS